MKLTKSKIVLLFAAAVILVIVTFIFYFYQQGSAEHYVPPKEKTVPSEAQVMADLATLSKAVEAFYSMNLNYPERLDNLQPDFISKLPVEPITGKNYAYDTDGSKKYRITVPNPGDYNLKVFANENGKIIKQ